ncbi:MAG TPA: terminase large subunit, partial [Candidatus Paceibacterota bacterium]
MPVVPKKRPEIAPANKSKVDPLEAARLAVIRTKYKVNFNTSRLAAEICERLPIPHAKQRLIENSTAKRKVINCGRRAGKTTEAARVSIIKMLEGRRVLLASTTQEQADTFWEKCKDWLDPFIQAGHVEKNETKRVMSMALTGGRIKVKTASDADTLRGDYADFLVLDECALLDPSAWHEVGAPMLLDNDGDCWFLSTPRRRNWFHGLYQKALDDDTGRWEAFHFTSHDNPHLSKEALDEITRELTSDSYRQEILAEFLEGEGAVFRNITPNLVAPDFPEP